MKLQTRIFIGLVAGAAVGFVARLPAMSLLAEAVRAVEPLGTIFIRLITMIVIPLVVASLFAGVASLGDVRRLGRIGARTLAYFLGTTVLSALVGLAVALAAGVGSGLDPTVRDAIANRFQGAAASASATAASAPGLVSTLVGMVPQNPFAAAAQGDLLPLIVAVLFFAAATTALPDERRRPLVEFFRSVNDASMLVIQWTMRAAPIAVFILLAVTVAESGLDLLVSLATYALAVILALALAVILILTPPLVFGARLGVVAFTRAVTEPLLLAFSTSSSSVALPVSIAAVSERLGVPNEVAGFVLSTGTTLNKNGAAVYKAATAVFLAHLYGVPLGPGTLFTIVVTTVVASSAGAGVPGSSLVTTLIVLDAIGLGPNAAAGIALVAGIDRPLDMCRTTVNTLSNLVGTAWIARAEQRPVAASA